MLSFNGQACGGSAVRLIFSLLLVLLTTAGFTTPNACGSVLARIDLSDQRMEVLVDGQLRHQWPVSTGRGSYRTPTGTWQPTRMHTMWYSQRYDNAPMPHAIFFYGGYAVHGTTEISRLGTPASHGCVRLHPDNARTLFYLVREQGPANTRIQIRP